MNYLNFKKRCLKAKKIQYLLFALLLINLSSCYSVKKRIGDPEVYLYKEQASYMDGTYFVDPYKTNGNFKLLTEIFDLEQAGNESKVDFKFLDDKNLQISYKSNSKTFSKIIQGKMKNGGFRYEYRNLPIGIPLLLFNYTFRVHHISLGNDDNIIITEYESSFSHFFFLSGSSKTENRYYFDRQLK